MIALIAQIRTPDRAHIPFRLAEALQKMPHKINQKQSKTINNSNLHFEYDLIGKMAKGAVQSLNRK